MEHLRSQSSVAKPDACSRSIVDLFVSPLGLDLHGLQSAPRIVRPDSAMATAACAVPMAKWLELNGRMLEILAAQAPFQGIVFVALMVKSNWIARDANFASRTPAE
jgi:hypothetical protein